MNETTVKIKNEKVVTLSEIRRIGKNERARIIKPEQLAAFRYPLPESLLKAAGLLKDRRRVLERHITKVRSEWAEKSS